jgi:hypothetical protein
VIAVSVGFRSVAVEACRVCHYWSCRRVADEDVAIGA